MSIDFAGESVHLTGPLLLRERNGAARRARLRRRQARHAVQAEPARVEPDCEAAGREHVRGDLFSTTHPALGLGAYRSALNLIDMDF